MFKFDDIFLSNLEYVEREKIESILKTWGLQQEEFYKKIDLWFQNFSSDDKEIALKIFLNIDYLRPEAIDKRLNYLFTEVKKNLYELNKTEFDLIIGIPDEKGDSATRSSYDLLKAWNLTQEQIHDIKSLKKLDLTNKVVVFFNDTHGSGNQFIRDILTKIADIKAPVFVVCLTITETALINFRNANENLVVIPKNRSKTVFDILLDSEVKRIRELGYAIYPKHPLGYGETALLTAYYYQCPNNTLPIIWANGFNNLVDGVVRKWNPLFEYRAKRNLKDFVVHENRVFQDKVKEIKSELISVKDNQIIKVYDKLDFDSLPNLLKISFIKGDKFSIAKNLEIFLTNFKRKYIQIGNPILLYNEVNEFFLKVEKIIPGTTIQIAKFHLFLSRLLINSDYNQELLELAKSHAWKAIQILENADLFDKEVFGQLSKAYWLHALSVKMQGNNSEAYRMISNSLQEIRSEKLGEYLDTIYLERHKAILENEKESFDILLQNIKKYKHNLIESYFTSKRVFEFSVENKCFSTLTSDFNRVRKYYKEAAPFLDLVSKISYLKYSFIYLKYNKKDELADRIFNFLVRKSTDNSISGQTRSLKLLQDEFYK